MREWLESIIFMLGAPSMEMVLCQRIIEAIGGHLVRAERGGLTASTHWEASQSEIQGIVAWSRPSTIVMVESGYMGEAERHLPWSPEIIRIDHHADDDNPHVAPGDEGVLSSAYRLLAWILSNTPDFEATLELLDAARISVRKTEKIGRIDHRMRANLEEIDLSALDRTVFGGMIARAKAGLPACPRSNDFVDTAPLMTGAGGLETEAIRLAALSSDLRPVIWHDGPMGRTAQIEHGGVFDGAYAEVLENLGGEMVHFDPRNRAEILAPTGALS